MQHDKKVGLALAILLVSIVGAFFFREEGSRGRNTPELKNPEKLDEAIAQGHDKRPYNDADSSKSRTHEVRRPADRPKDDLAPWELPEFLRDDDQTTAQRGIVNASKDPFGPDEPTNHSPIATTPKPRASSDNRAVAVPLPLENSDWQPLDSNKRIVQRESSAPVSVSTKTRTHVVAAGETLSSIAEKYLGSHSRYQDIFQANRDQLRSPDDLKVGMKLAIPDRQNGSKSSDTSRSLEANKVTSERNTKSARPTFTSPTSKVTTQPESNDSPSSKPSKLKFKPSKLNPALRRSADAEDEQKPGKALSQVLPGEFTEVDEGLLAELERDFDLSAPPADKQVATEPSPFRIASEETENASLDDDSSRGQD